MGDQESIWMYDPSFPLAVVGAVVYGIIFLVIAYLTLIKYRAWYFIVVVIGSAIEVAAYNLRIHSVQNQSEITPFVLTLTYTVLAPVLIAAGNYLLISRLILSVLPPSHHRILRIPGRRLTPIFVACDVIAFLIQGSGSGIASSDNWQGEMERIGVKILIAGLGFQLAAFSLFLCVFGRFHVLALRKSVDDAPRGWQKVVLAVYISSILIMVRCIFRVVEFAGGRDTYAFSHEWLFWVFESLPMVGAIGIFCFYHPSRYLGRNGVRSKSVRIEDTIELAQERK
ncbi:RTA1 like protein-domain-containing protein [Fusarium redolens]|uniref:RTA1 like protein-domain-containing protein n=1 Tax=Fusarium redolens TaxID=48865 RepID=A0A9P9HRK0_FUSRE|nr:RTA1 like protein-domain-containing protein [Fusarium redolens]KAH7261249.1 RTA1 like protein-domain-containing protein [Fusarium redolens]